MKVDKTQPLTKPVGNGSHRRNWVIGRCEVYAQIYAWGGFGCSPAYALSAAAVQVRANDFPHFSFLAHHALELRGCMKS
jgi:hypothetical protein